MKKRPQAEVLLAVFFQIAWGVERVRSPTLKVNKTNLP